MTVIGITFATEQYKDSAAVLRHSALNAGKFDEFIVFEKKDIQWLMDTYPDHFENSRGFGFWAWKPFLIRNVMSQRPDGDVIVYADSTMVFERSIEPYAKHVVENKPIILTRMGNWTSNDYRNRRWTKKSLFNAMGAGSVAGEHVQLNAAFQVYKNCAEARAFVDSYTNYCLQLDLVDDRGKDSDPEVVDTRHDQSILSILSSEHPRVTFSRDVTQWGMKDPPCSVAQPNGGTIEIDELNENGIMKNIINHHRKIMKVPKVAIITSTVCGKFLRDCVESVQKLTLPNVEHWIVVDGAEHEANVNAVLERYRHRLPIIKMTLPKNVGAGGWNGHRVFGSTPWLVDADYIAYLDDDNTVDPKFATELVKSIMTSPEARWSFCLRKLIGQNGDVLGVDNCESLGSITHTVMGPGDYLIDTGCYMLERNLAIEMSHNWNARARDPDGLPEVDRELCKSLLSSAPHGVVRKALLNYRVGSTAVSVKPEFFKSGNEFFGYDFEKYEDIYIFHFSQNATQDFLNARKLYKNKSYALEEWQMTLLRGLDGVNGGKYNLINGYTNFPNIPQNSTVLVSLCNPADIPVDFLKQRIDLNRVVYTLESPNIRHQGQWNAKWLSESFDVAMTYWKPLMENKTIQTIFVPHNTHHGDLDDPLDRAALLRENKGTGRSVCMVLERRPQLFHNRDYSINGTHMQCLDYLREQLVKGMKDVTVYGINWGEIADGENIKLGHAKHRSQDDQSAVDIKNNFVFDLVIENCDAEWYVSEKFYDSLSAGCIPLYYGNVYDELGGLIKEGPGGVYIDLKKRGIETGKDLKEFLDLIGDTEILEMRQNVVKHREEVLRHVDTKSFAGKVDEAIGLSKMTKQNLDM